MDNCSVECGGQGGGMWICDLVKIFGRKLIPVVWAWSIMNCIILAKYRLVCHHCILDTILYNIWMDISSYAAGGTLKTFYFPTHVKQRKKFHLWIILNHLRTWMVPPFYCSVVVFHYYSSIWGSWKKTVFLWDGCKIPPSGTVDKGCQNKPALPWHFLLSMTQGQPRSLIKFDCIR